MNARELAALGARLKECDTYRWEEDLYAYQPGGSASYVYDLIFLDTLKVCFGREPFDEYVIGAALMADSRMQYAFDIVPYQVIDPGTAGARLNGHAYVLIHRWLEGLTGREILGRILYRREAGLYQIAMVPPSRPLDGV